MGKKILIAVDGSEHSMRASEKAVYFSGLMDAGLLLVHCHKKFPAIIGEPYLQKAVDVIQRTANELVKPFQDLFTEKKVDHTTIILEGPAGTIIPRIAEIEACDMIVMGSRGLSDLAGLFIGSVTHRVLRLAKCPVLVIR